MLAALFDSHVLDHLADSPDDLATLLQAQREGYLRLISTHILRDEIDAMLVDRQGAPTDAHRPRWRQLDAVLKALSFDVRPTAGFVLDASRLDMAALGSEGDGYDELSVNNIKNTEDALLTLTAERDGAMFVTNDRGARNRALARGVQAIPPTEFIKMLPARVHDDR